MADLTPGQIDYLLRPINPARVAITDGQSYVPQQDVRAHLTRIFGFGRWSMHVLESAMIFEEPVTWTKNGQEKSGYDALWRATVRLEIRDQHGAHLATYEDAATGDAQHQTRLAAHDLALKSAVSTALKRAATCLGDQFGLSLYNKGSLDAFVSWAHRLEVEAVPAEELPAEVPAGTEEEHPAPEGFDDEDERRRKEAATPPVAASEPPPEPQAPAQGSADALEAEIAQLHAWRESRNAQRRGPYAAMAHAADAIHEAMPDWTKEEVAAEVLDWIHKENGHTRAAGTVTDLDYEACADHYERMTDDGIRARHAARG